MRLNERGASVTSTVLIGPESTPPKPARDRSGLLGMGFADDDAFNWGIFLLAFVIALSGHGMLGMGASKAPAKKMTERIEMAVVKPKPPPPPPEPPPPPPKEEKPKPKPKELPPPPPKEPPPPPPSNDVPPPEPPKEVVPIVTGINLNSVVKGNTGMNVRVGNTTYGDPNGEKFVDPSQVKPYIGGTPGFKAAKAALISKEVEVVCRVKPAYPKDIADQGIEGVVELLISVNSGSALVNSRVSRSSGNKTLDALALEGIKKCVFKAGEIDGEKVDSNLRYKFRFELID
ncbi:MAG: energy transducer TonB [Deltaproteobacteria bacterium]|nr:energy transducer TonB [Deltaproteobacteria bacterium]